MARADSIRPASVRDDVNEAAARDSSQWMGATEYWGRFSVVPIHGQQSGNGETKRVNPFREGGEDRQGFQQAAMQQVASYLNGTQDVTPTAGPAGAVLPALLNSNSPHLPDLEALVTGGRFGSGVAVVGMPGQPLPTPEPASLVLLGSGLAGIAATVYRRRRRVSHG